MIKRKVAMAAIAIAVAGLTVAPAAAREFVFGAFVGPKHGLIQYAMPKYVEQIAERTKGAIKWKVVPGGSLVNGRSTLAGVRDGLVDGGIVIPSFVPKNVAALNLVYAKLILGDDVIGAGGAALETVMLHCPECIDDMKKNNAVLIAGYMTTPFGLISRSKVASVADLKGLKVRVAAGGAQLFKLADATPVSMLPSDAVTALQRGALDCVWGPASWLRSYGFQDVAKYFTQKPLGMHGPVLHVTLNRNTWNNMTRAEKQAHLDFAPGVISRATIDAYIEEDKRVIAAAKTKGVTFVKGGSDFDRWLESYTHVDRETNLRNAKALGVKHGPEIVSAYEAALEKWGRLSKEIGTDHAKFEAALKREIYDKLDIDSM